MNNTHNNVLSIIQARMGSTRLPGKVMQEVAGKPLLQHVIERVQKARSIHRVIVATSIDPANDPLQILCHRLEIECFRGSEEDVLDRYYQAARHFQASAVVRITSDCPLLDPAIVDQTVQIYLDGEYDYVTNTLPCTYPDGLDVEVIRFESLEHAWKEAALKSEREHVTPYIRNHPRIFRQSNLLHETDLSGMRWTVDEAADLQFVRAVYDHIGETSFGLNEVLALLKEHPELQHLNQGIERNAGYQKSLREDQVVK